MIMKKIVIALLVSTSPLAFSGSMGSVCDSSDVKTPCASNAWQVGGQALYLQTTSTFGQSNSGVTQSSGQNINYAQPWNWGFRLEAAYQYGKANDINVNWSHLDQSSQRTINGPFLIDQLYAHPASSSASLTLDPKWDSVNIEAGQQIILNDNKVVRFHGGVEYLRVDNTNARIVSSPSTSSTYIDTRDSSFNGFGPRVGLDFNYTWDQRINFYVNTAAGLLAGQAKANLHDLDTVLGVPTTTLGSDSVMRVVPELEGKLGIQYNYALAQGHLVADVGWMWANYFNAQSSFLAGQQDITIEDFALQGLSFGLKWQGELG